MSATEYLICVFCDEGKEIGIDMDETPREAIKSFIKDSYWDDLSHSGYICPKCVGESEGRLDKIYNLDIKIKWISRCKCGAVTIDGISVSGEKFSNSFTCSDKTFEAMKEKFNFNESGDIYSCNHCVNHWGLDLCACGSGSKTEECTEGFECCNHPMQRIGE